MNRIRSRLAANGIHPSRDSRRRRALVATALVATVAVGMRLDATPTATTVAPTAAASGVVALDPSGATIPDTNYPVPSGAIHLATNGADSNNGVAAPVRTLTRAIALVPSGGTIVVAGGTYRDWYSSSGTTFSIASKPFTLQAAAHSQVWFDGTDPIAAGRWTAAGSGHWSMVWSTPDFCNNLYYSVPLNAQRADNSGPCAHVDMSRDAANPMAVDPQMVYADGVREHEASSLAAATGGAFYYDVAARRIYISTDPSTHAIELAARPMALASGVGNTRIMGVGFSRYATNEYDNITHGAVFLGGSTNTIQDSVFKEMAGGGASIAPQNSKVVNSVLTSNGFDGLGSNGHAHSTGAADGLLIQGNLVNNNNTEHFGTGCSLSCAQAGIKIAHMVGFTVRDNIFENNWGQGFWCDENCTNGVIVDNIARGNQKDGLFYEVSSKGTIASNLSYDNGEGGIRVASATTRVYNNTMVDNGTYSLWVYDDARSPTAPPSDVGPDTTGVVVANNILSGGSAMSLWTQRSSSSGSNTGPNTFFAGLDYDSYYRSGGASTNLVHWVDTTNAGIYKSMQAFHAAHGWESHGDDIAGGADPFFISAANKDYVVRNGSVAKGTAEAIPADIAAWVGTPAATGGDRGARVWPGRGASPTPTPQPSATATATATAPPTAHPSATPTATPTAPPTAPPTAQPTATPQPTANSTPTPTPAPPSSVGFQAEQLPSNGRVISDTSASGGRALALWWTGQMSGAVDAPASTTITVRARGSICEGAPAMTVSVDNDVVGSVTVSATEWTDYTFSVGNLGAGVHTITVAFPNDKYLAGQCDRNLFLDTMQLQN